jgi:glycosyltransferase involved in cell wall biosynthesis
MTPKLSILTPAIWRRIDKTHKLAELIAPHPQVEHVVILDNMTRSVGLKRQACLDSAIGNYVMFVDDDDGILPDTIPLILAAIKHAPDVITFKQAASYNGKESEVVFHLNHQDGPFVEGGQTLRAPWHVCAWKRELVADCLFPDISYGEDRIWAEQARRRVKSGCHIDQVLHRYTHDARETAAPESNDDMKIHPLMHCSKCGELRGHGHICNPNAKLGN